MMYLVKKEFVTGLLAGISIVEKTNVPFKVGKVYTSCVNKAQYKIVEVIKC